jgi:hypothetical protein
MDLMETARQQSLASLLDVILRLRKSPEWQELKAYLTLLHNRALSDLSELEEFNEFLEARGVVKALKAILGFEDDLRTQVEELRHARTGDPGSE